jgi:hypothetical protein
LQPAVKQIAAKMMQLIGGESPSGKIDRKLAY